MAEEVEETPTEDTSAKDLLTKDDLDFIGSALNAHWNQAHYDLLEKKGLGDIEKENLELQRIRSKEIMKKLGIC